MNQPPVYTPYASGETGFRIGLRLLDVDHWMEPDDQAVVQFDNKRKLLAERHGDVVATLPESESPQQEFLSLLVSYLLRQFPELYERDGSLVRLNHTGDVVDIADKGLAPIDRAGRLVQEDLCLLQQMAGGYTLTAASMCAPSAWRLADKIGKPLIDIHEPVPGYADPLAPRVDRIFNNIKPDGPMWRANWSIMTEPTLFLPGAHDRSPDRLVGLLPQTAGDRLFIRVERQTVRRLPVTGAVIFTIKTYIDPIRSISEQPELMLGLKRAVEGMPPEMVQYKAIEPIRHALVGWLDWCLRVYSK